MSDSLEPPATHEEQFVQALTAHQNRIYAYVYSLVADHSRAADVLQETNLVLWRKKTEFIVGRPFLPWAFAIARNQVLANIRDKRRDRCLLDESLIESLAAESEQQALELDATRIALRTCVLQLNDSQRELIACRYDRGLTIRQMEETLGRGASAIKVALLRARRQLAACVRKRLAWKHA